MRLVAIRDGDRRNSYCLRCSGESRRLILFCIHEHPILYRFKNQAGVAGGIVAGYLLYLSRHCMQRQGQALSEDHAPVPPHSSPHYDDEKRRSFRELASAIMGSKPDSSSGIERHEWYKVRIVTIFDGSNDPAFKPMPLLIWNPIPRTFIFIQATGIETDGE